MNRKTAAGLLALVMVSCARTTPEKSALDEAAAALGGAQRIRDLKGFVLHGTGSAPNAGQNRMPDDDLPVWKINEYVRSVDLTNGRARAELYAKALGKRVVRLVAVSETGGYAQPPMPMFERGMAAQAADTKIVPGEQSIQVNLTMVFELQ